MKLRLERINSIVTRWEGSGVRNALEIDATMNLSQLKDFLCELYEYYPMEDLDGVLREVLEDV